MADQRPKSVQSTQHRNITGRTLPDSRILSGSSHAVTVVSGHRQKERPKWDDNIHDMAEFRDTQEERQQRKASHVSKNIKLAQRELQEKNIRNGMEKPVTILRHCSKKGPVIREMILSLDDITDMIEESNRVLEEARNLLENHHRNIAQ